MIKTNNKKKTGPAKMKTDLFTTLEEGKMFFKDNRGAGAICPCCSRYGKTYKRKITSNIRSSPALTLLSPVGCYTQR